MPGKAEREFSHLPLGARQDWYALHKSWTDLLIWFSISPRGGIEKLFGLMMKIMALRGSIIRRRGTNSIIIGLSNIIGERPNRTELRHETKNFIWIHIVRGEGGDVPWKME